MNSRAVAANILQQVLKNRHSLTAALDTALPAVSSVQDRAFIQALCYGVVRHYFELEALLNALLDKPLKTKESEIKALALLGLYQLKHMRVKEHAAVSETVAAAKKHPWAKALLNAVFRRYGREREHLDAALSQDWQTRYNHPDWLITHIKHDWQVRAEALLIANNQAPPLALRVNLARCSREKYLDLLATAGIGAAIGEFSPAAVMLDQPIPVAELPQFSEGWVSVQDTAAQFAAQLLDVQAGQRVLDLCAAPGGKTCAILETQPQVKSLWAVDVDAQRLQRVQDNLGRLGLQAHLRTGDALAVASWWDGQLFERILVDAPCSALGVIRRHPDIKLLRLASDLVPLVGLQQRILQQAWQMLASGGILLYATCSVLKQENELQIQRFLQQQADASELIIEASWGLQASVGRQILTGMQAMDGFYYARLRKA